MRLWIDTAALGTAGQAVQAKVGEMKQSKSTGVVKRNKSGQPAQKRRIGSPQRKRKRKNLQEISI